LKQSKTFEVTIVVFPFENMSEEKNLDYFVDGFYDDFLMDLSRFSSLQIISQKSAEKISKEQTSLATFNDLGSDFIIKGKLRKFEDKVKIYIQLIASKTETIIWGNRFEENIEHIFEIQDDIIKSVVNSIQDQIDINLLSRSRKKKPKNLEVYEYWLKGYDQLKKGNLKSDLKARVFFKKALEKDEFCSRAYTGISLSYFNEWSCQLWDLWDASMMNALKYAKLAIALDPNDTVSLTVIGRIFLYQGDYERGEYYLKKSLDLNPNEANNLAQIAVSYIYLGHYKEALKLYKKAKKLNPLKEDDYYASGALIYFEMGEFEKSIQHGLKANFQNAWVDLTAMISAAYYMTGDIENMKKYWNIYLINFREQICHGKKMDSQEALDWIIRISPYKKESRFIPFWEYLKKTNFLESVLSETTKIKQDSRQNIFSKGTGLWELSYKGKTVFLSDKKGYHDLLKLLEFPDEKYTASELMGSKINIERKALVIDEKAKKEYQQKLRSLQAEIDEYDERNDYENLKSARESYDSLLDHLTQSLNLKGGRKKFQDSGDKARSAVTWRIRNAIKTIQTANYELGKHLSASITTGNLCSYSPEIKIDWVLEK
jgi:TolB-like protein